MISLRDFVLLISVCGIPILLVWHTIRMLYWVFRIPRNIPWAGVLEQSMTGKMRVMLLSLTSTSQLAEDGYNKIG